MKMENMSTMESLLCRPLAPEPIFFARSRIHRNIRVLVLRHGMGKVRAVRIATNIPECIANAWVYETAAGNFSQLPHFQMESLPSTDRDEDDEVRLAEDIRVKQGWSAFLSGVFQFTQRQQTTDWFLARMFCFTSTTFHVVINVSTAVYFNTMQLRNLFEYCKEVVQISPQNHVTVDNALALEDLDLPGQRGNLIRVFERQGEEAGRNRRVVHVNSTPAFWLRGNQTKPQLQELCDNNYIPFLPTNTRAQLAGLLANKFAMDNQATEGEEEMNSNDVPIDDHDAKIAFIHRMMPHWFMYTFATVAGGAIEHVSAN